VVGCSRVGSRAAAPAFVRTSRTVRVVGVDYPRGAFWPRCSLCSSRVLERLHFDPVGQRFLVGRCLADRPLGRHGLSARHELLADRPRMWYGPRPRVEVPVGSFCLCLTDNPPWVTDRPRGDRGQPARVAAGQLCPLLLALCFRFGIVWGLFLGLVRPY
jgi:hypothetical protein